MNNKKYEILMEEKNTIRWKGHTLHRIKALRDFGDVRKGELGGFIEKEYNLSHEGNCWIYNNAKAMDNSRLYDNSAMYDYSEISGNSEMHDSSMMYDSSEMNDNSKMYGKSEIHDNSTMYGNSEINDIPMYGDSKMCK